MNVRIRVVGITNPREVGWPAAWPPPREGETLWEIPGLPTMRVRSVSWYPYGSDPDRGQPSDPFVYVVIGPA